MLLALLVFLLVVVLVVAMFAHAHGIVHISRTCGGLTSVHDDFRVMGERVRVLEVAGTYQSATYLDDRWCDPVFPYHRLYEHLFEAWPEGQGPAAIAILGGGGYALPKHLVAHHPEVTRIDVVELDPAIERIARRHFFLSRLEEQTGAERSGRLRLHLGEARQWLAETSQRFDAILNDCFLASEPEASLMTLEGVQLVWSRLVPGGLYLTNVVAALDGPDSNLLYQALDTLAQVFAYVWLYPCGSHTPHMRENNMVIASDRHLTLTQAWEWPTRQ